MLFKIIIGAENSHSLMVATDNIISWLRKSLTVLEQGWVNTRYLLKSCSIPCSRQGCWSRRNSSPCPSASPKPSGTQKRNQRQHAESGKLQPSKAYQSLQMLKQFPLPKLWVVTQLLLKRNLIFTGEAVASSADETLDLNFFKVLLSPPLAYVYGRQEQPEPAAT